MQNHWITRIPEMIENLKNEFDKMSNDYLNTKNKLEDYEKTIKSQINDAKNMENTIIELKNKHQIVKQQYTDEINLLKEKYGVVEINNNQNSNISLSALKLRELSTTTTTPSKKPKISEDSYDPSNNPLLGAINQMLPDNEENSRPNSNGLPKTENPMFNQLKMNLSSQQKTNLQNYSTTNSYQNNNNSFIQKVNPNLNQQQGMHTQNMLTQGMIPQQGLMTKQIINQSIATKIPVKQPNYAIKNQHFHNIQVLPNPSINYNQIQIHPSQMNQNIPPQKTYPKKVPNNPPKMPNNNQPINYPNSPIAKNTIDKPKKANTPQRNPKVPVLQMIKVPSQKGSDWQVKKNGLIESPLNVDLQHNIDHDSVVCCVKFSHDGRYLATGCNKRAFIYSTDSGEIVHSLYDQNAQDKQDLYIRSVCFSPNGKFIATGAEDKTVKVWDIEQKTNQTFNGHTLDIYSLDYSPDGRIIASGSGDKKVKVWNVEENKCCYTFGDDELGPKDGVTSVAISPDGRLVAAGSLDKIVRIWDLSTGFFLERYEGHEDSVYSVAFSPDGKTLVSGSLDKTLKIWDLSGGRSRAKCVSSFEGHNDFVLSVAFSKDARWIVSGSKDRNIIFWDPRTTFPHLMLQGHRNSVISVDVSPVSKLFASGSGDFRSRIWNYT